MFKKIIPILFLYLFAVSLVSAKEEPSTYHYIHIGGDTYFSIDTLLDVVGATKKNFFQFWKDEKPKIDDKLIPTLIPTLENFYESEGFYHAKIKMKEDNSTVNIWIDANKPVIVKDINISSDFHLHDIITFRKNERFSAKKFVKIKANIIQKLLEEGYCSYDLDTKAYVDLENNTVSLLYRLKKGGVCKFGDTYIKGLKTIDKSVVMSRVRAKKGARFSTKKIQETYTDVYNLDSFDRVSVDFNRKFFNVVPIDITLEEVTQPYHYELGAGYDTYIGARVHGEIIKKNFFGNAQKASLKLAWSQREQLAMVNFFKPALFWFFGYGIDFGVNGGYSNLEYIGFREEKSSGRLFLEHNEGRLAVKIGLALEDIRISLLNNNSSTLQQAINTGSFLLFYPYMHLIYDARDDKLNPKEGYYIEGKLEYALPYKPEATSYIKSYLEGRVIHTIKEMTLAAVLKAGVVDVNSNELPESKLFFAGGSFSNRAYGYNTIGVILSPTKDSIYGASTMLNLSLETDFPINGNLYGAVFTDNTMLTAKSYDFSGEVITSAGVGVRYMTPIGPFKLDIGFNVHKPSQYGISFQIGQSF